LEQAEEYLSRSLVLGPEMVEALLAMARVCSLKRDYEESLKHLKAAAELRPNDPQLHYRLSETYRNLGRSADAQRELNLFRELNAAQEKP
jgi:tetratricopeptide (TPR) repeat protein